MSADPEHPGPLSRRREVGATSARSLLLTVLGEFVLPSAAPVWTRTIVDVLGALDVEEKSARQALARVAADGVVGSVREGRQVRWSLSDAGHRLLSEGAERIYGHGAARPAWDRRWMLVVASVPEQHRRLRHRLRTRLAWLGLGSPAPGVWLGPDAGRVDAVRAVLDDLELADAFVVAGPDVAGPPHAELVARAWDLTGLEALYQAFLEQFADLAPATDADALVAQTRLVDAWRRFPFLDPGLPEELLPPRWPGHPAAELFHARHAAWRDAADRGWRRRSA